MHIVNIEDLLSALSDREEQIKNHTTMNNDEDMTTVEDIDDKDDGTTESLPSLDWTEENYCIKDNGVMDVLEGLKDTDDGTYEDSPIGESLDIFSNTKHNAGFVARCQPSDILPVFAWHRIMKVEQNNSENNMME